MVSADWQENSKENFKASLKSFWVCKSENLLKIWFWTISLDRATDKGWGLQNSFGDLLNLRKDLQNEFDLLGKMSIRSLT